MMNQEYKEEELTIDLAELFLQLWSKAHIILLAGVMTALLAFVGTKVFLTPQYTSVTKVYVLSKQDSSAGVTYNDLQTGTQLTKDYMELVTSRPVLEQTIATLNLDMEAEELKSKVSVETPADTRILSISVTDKDPKEAKEIADVLRESVSIQITEIMDAGSVNTVEEGNLPTSPSSPNVMKNMVLGGMLGILLAAGLITAFFMLDDTIKTPDDVEQYLGLNVLTSIPVQGNVKAVKKSKKQRAKKPTRNTRR